MASSPFEIQNRRGAALRGDVYDPQDLRGRLPTVVVVHGFKGFKDWGFFPLLCERICEAGLLAVAYNNSGSGIGADGQSFSEREAFAGNTISAELEDLSAVLEALADDRIAAGRADMQRTGLMGHSRGGAVAILHAATHAAFSALVTWSAVAHLDRFTAAQRDEWRARGTWDVRNARTGEILHLNSSFLDDLEENAAVLDVVAHEPLLNIPHLLIHGEDDESVPVADAQDLATAARDNSGFEMRLIPGAGHTFGARHPLLEITPELDEAMTRTCLFFCRWLQ